MAKRPDPENDLSFDERIPPSPDMEENDCEEIAEIDKEMEERLSEWAIQDNVENVSSYAILYRYVDPKTSNRMEQINRFDILPSRHDIGIQYGGGKYYLIAIRPAKGKQAARRTSYRFTLADTYNILKAENEAKKHPSFPVPAFPMPQENRGDSFKEAMATINMVMSTMMQSINPLIARLMDSRTQAPVPANSGNDYGAMKMVNEMMRGQVKENVRFYNDIMKGILTMNPTGTTQEIEDETTVTEPAPEPDFLTRIIKLIEPVIPLLAQNSLKSRAIAAGFQAIPEVKNTIKEISRSPEMVKEIVSYVVEKEGVEGAQTVLKNMGIDPSKYNIKLVMPGEKKAVPVIKKPVKK